MRRLGAAVNYFRAPLYPGHWHFHQGYPCFHFQAWKTPSTIRCPYLSLDENLPLRHMIRTLLLLSIGLLGLLPLGSSLDFLRNIRRTNNLLTPLKKLAPYFDESVSREVSGQRSNRVYANETKLRQLSGQVTRDYLITSPGEPFRATPDTIWITAPFRISVVVIAYTVYPHLIIEGVRGILPDNSEGVTAVTSGFAPAISLLYGSWLGLTFNILEQRIVELQRTAIRESAMLCSLCERTALLVHDINVPSKSSTMKLFEALFEQTTTLAIRSRQDELLQIANDDIYWVYRCCLKELQNDDVTFVPKDSVKDDIRACKDIVDELVLVRAERLSKETKSLPSAHFIILAIFSLQLLACFVFVIAQTPASLDDPALRLAFSFFAAVYLLVFNFAIDLNDPFRGNYQIRRSAINANLIAARKQITSAVGVEVSSSWRDRANLT